MSPRNIVRHNPITDVLIRFGTMNLARPVRQATVMDEDCSVTCQHAVGVRLRRYFSGLWDVEHGFCLASVRSVAVVDGNPEDQAGIANAARTA